MAKSNEELSSNLSKAGAPMVPLAFEKDIKNWYWTNRKRILALVGGDESRAALFISSAFAQVNRIPKLIECTPESFFQCLIYSMGTNLLPGPMQECAFVPYAGEATFIPMYQGLTKLVYNGGFVTKIVGEVVREHDEFDYNDAKGDVFHRRGKGGTEKRGKRIGAYSGLLNTMGQWQYMWLEEEQILSIKAQSRAAKSEYSPWNSKLESSVDQMWIKTPFRRATKWVPKNASPASMQLARAIELDNKADMEDQSIIAGLLDDDAARVLETIVAPESERVAVMTMNKPFDPADMKD